MTEDLDLALVPLEKLLEELQGRCLASVVALDVAVDGNPDSTRLYIYSSGAMSSRLGLSLAMSTKVQADFHEDFICGYGDEGVEDG